MSLEALHFQNTKTQLKTQFTLSLVNGKIEPACYWCCELICAGHFMDVWEVVFILLANIFTLLTQKYLFILKKDTGCFVMLCIKVCF